MSIPLATTSITVWEPTQASLDAEPYSGAPDSLEGYAASSSHVRAVIGAPRGTELTRGGEQTELYARLTCDPTPMTRLSRVVDETTGQAYGVEWCQLRTGLNREQSHLEASLRQVSGSV